MQTIIKGLIFAYGIPLMLIVMSRMLPPDLSRPKGDFPSEVFTPTRIAMHEKRGARGSDHFEVTLDHPQGHRYFHRDPDPEPIAELHGRIPRDTPLKVVYSPSWEGNVLLEISRANAKDEPILSFEEVMAEHVFRRRVISIIAGIWFLFGNGILFFILWNARADKAAIEMSHPD